MRAIPASQPRQVVLPIPVTHPHGGPVLTALRDPKIRQQVESYLPELLRSLSGELAGVATGPPQGLSFNKEVRNWNPNVPVSRRSPKE